MSWISCPSHTSSPACNSHFLINRVSKQARLILRCLHVISTLSIWTNSNIDSCLNITCLKVMGFLSLPRQTSSSARVLIHFLIYRNRCFRFMHDEAWTGLSTFNDKHRTRIVMNSSIFDDFKFFLCAQDFICRITLCNWEIYGICLQSYILSDVRFAY